HEAGAATPMWLGYDQVVSLIRGAGKQPAERDSLYQTVRMFEDWVPAVPGVRPRGPKGPTFQISHRLQAGARGRRLPVLSAVDASECVHTLQGALGEALPLRAMPRRAQALACGQHASR